MFFPPKEFSKDHYIRDYLQLLEADKKAPSLDYLARLMESHIYKVTFDGSNFTLNHPEKIALNNKDILNSFKAGKGAVCYQANGAFNKLLRLLGFDSTLVTVTMFRFGEEEFPYAKNNHDVHCALLVKLEQNEYLVDLIWGNSFRSPVMIGQEVSSPGGTFKVEVVDQNEQKTYQLHRLIANQWVVEYQFINVNKKTKDFVNDIKFICSDEHHMSKKLLLMKPKLGYAFDFVVGEKSNNLLYFKTTPNQASLKEVITDEERAREVLSEFNVDEENTAEIIRCFKL